MSELFIELSDQQQELVAGGFVLKNINHTSFTQRYQAAGATGLSQSGPLGSINGGDVFAVSDYVETKGSNKLVVRF